MKVLLTGGAGYIGSHTAVELAKLGHDIVIVDNFSNSKPEVLNRLKTIIGHGFKGYTEAVDFLADHSADAL